jgi:TorA maturation chaperone TorD
MVGDRELHAFREGSYQLLVSLLWKEPASEVLSTLAQGQAARVEAARALHPLCGEGWEEIGRVLAEGAPVAVAEAVADEYTRLFIGPHRPVLYLYESYYLTGRLMDRPLAALRQRLAALGIGRVEGYLEPEDFLAFELDVMRQLIARQRAASDPDAEAHWLNAQSAFLKRHLLVWGPAVAKDMAGSEGARFYRGIGKVLQGFLELERELFADWGDEEVLSLEEARREFAGRGEWKGPLVDFTGGASGEADPS